MNVLLPLTTFTSTVTPTANKFQNHLLSQTFLVLYNRVPTPPSGPKPNPLPQLAAVVSNEILAIYTEDSTHLRHS